VAERQLAELLGIPQAPIQVERRKELRLPGQVRIAG
jgi:hypothetical protein